MLKPKPASRRRHAAVVSLLILILFAAVAGPSALGQSNDPERESALKLYEAGRYADALPLLEKLAVKYPDDPVVLSRLGFTLYVTSSTLKDPAERRKIRERARAILLKSQQHGDDSNLTHAALDALNSPDTTDIPFSNIRDAERAIRDGEAAFAGGDLDAALAHYKRALELDPRLYEAALYAGDMYFKKGYASEDKKAGGELMDKAGEWFARAAAINADRETAYRYWGDALMWQDRRDDARAKFVEAVVAEPYTRSSWVGLAQWAQKYNVRLAHLRVDVPKEAAAGDPVWGPYAAARAEWRSRRFAAEFPGESAYRHSLAEESAALRAEAVAASSSAWAGKELTTSLQNLVELNKAGLLEAYVLFALTDDGVARDYAAYRKANRDRLRRYLLDYVSSGKN
jgi:tetratricopeptide (TPR) repeat protein